MKIFILLLLLPTMCFSQLDFLSQLDQNLTPRFIHENFGIEIGILQEPYCDFSIESKYQIGNDIIVVISKLSTGISLEIFVSTFLNDGTKIEKTTLAEGIDDPGDDPFTTYQEYNKMDKQLFEIIVHETKPYPKDEHLIYEPNIDWLTKDLIETKQYKYLRILDSGKFEFLSNKNKYSSDRKYGFVSQRIIESYELDNYSKTDWRIMRNEIFADYGYKFNTDAMRQYFEQQTWYKPELENVNDSITDVERINIQTLIEREKN